MELREWEALIAAALSGTLPEGGDEQAGFARELPALLRSARMEEPPAHLVSAALAVGRERRSGAVRELIARLVTPAERGPVLAVRGEGTAELESLRFQVEGYDLDFTHLATGSLMGQVLPLEDDTPEIDAGDSYLYGAGDARVAAIEDGGELRFADVPEGIYTLVIETADLRLVVPELDLSRAR